MPNREHRSENHKRNTRRYIMDNMEGYNGEYGSSSILKRGQNTENDDLR